MISVIISTFNSPERLERVLWGYFAQTMKDFEIVIADDGSTQETAQLIRTFQEETGMRMLHVWHEDEGFRKTVILNKAILASNGDYLIFTDGDCVPRKDFVYTHAKLARPGYFLVGTAYYLSAKTSRTITREVILSGGCFSPRWLLAHGFYSVGRLIKLSSTQLLTSIADHLTLAPVHWGGGNASAWHSDIVAVNGFNEKMGYGGEDAEFGIRLLNLGLLGNKVRNRAVVLHLEHSRPYADEEIMRQNELIVKNVEKSKIIRCTNGLVKDK